MKILITDEHALFRDNLARCLNDINKDNMVIQVSSFAQTLKILEKEQNIDIVVLDTDMLDTHTEHGIEKIQNLAASTRLVLISASEDMEKIKKIISLGIAGYIPRQTDINIFKEAFENILKGKQYIPAALQSSNANSFDITNKKLTNRQSQVLDLIAQGKSNKQIAFEMGVSEATVKLHINALLRSLKVNNRTQAVITAQKIGLI